MEFIMMRSQVSVVDHPADSSKQFTFLLLSEKTKAIKT